MIRFILLVLTVLVMSACTTMVPSSTPAPVKEAGSEAPGGTMAKGIPAPEESEGGATVYPLEPQGGTEVYAYRTPEPVAAKPTSAVVALTGQAEKQQRDGDLNGSAATLERALRIEPRNPHLWNRLARVRLAQGQFNQANSMAAKSNALAGDNPGLKKDNWQLIAQAKNQTGDSRGAAEAQRKAEALAR